MEHDTKQPQWMTSDKNSFAYQSARDRWPIIITQAIDDVHKAVAKATDKDAQTEGKQLIEQLATLKYELQHNRELTALPEKGQLDIPSYNAELAALPSKNWHSLPWLYSECYMYRRMALIFQQSAHWRSHDFFAAIKTSTFRSSRIAVLELATKYNSIIQTLRNPANASAGTGGLSSGEQAQAERTLFTEMVEICLWGNATDLSLLASASYVDIASLQGAEARRKAEANILVNDVGKAYDVLLKAKREGKEERRVDIVLDNAGFELFVDVVLAGYLLHAGLATVVVFHPKDIPWFVSDVVPRDFAGLFEGLMNGQDFFGQPTEGDVASGKAVQPVSQADLAVLKDLSDDFAELYAEGSFVLRPNRFWTEGGSFWRMKATAASLYEDLRGSELVISKGDLNYRKFTADGMWAPTTPFQDALGPLGKDSDLRILALRTCKGDVIVGLPEGRDEELKAMKDGGGDSGARKWAWTGKWAVIEYSDGKTQ